MFRKLSTRITVSVIAGGGAVIFALVALQVKLGQNDTRALMGKQLYALVTRAADDIDGRVVVRLNALSNTARALKATTVLDPQAADDYLAERPGLQALFDNLLIFDAGGKIVADYPHLPGRAGLVAAEREYFIRVRETLRPYVSQPFVPKNQERAIVNFAVPLLDERGRFAGILSGTVELLSDTFFGEIRNARIGETGYFVVATRSGMALVHPNPTFMMKPVPSAESNPTLHRALDGWNGWAEGPLRDGSTALLAYRNQKAVDWVVGGVMPTDEAYAPLWSTTRWIGAAAVAAIVALSILMWAVISRNLATLQQLRINVQGLHPGQRADVLDIGGPEEVQLLARAFSDLDARRLAVKAELIEREAFHRALIESSPLGVFVIDWQGGCTYVNERFERLAGLRFAEVQGRQWMFLVHPDDLPRVSKEWEDAKDDDGMFESEHRFPRPDGTVLWVHVRATAVHVKGKEDIYIGVASDVTAQRRARDELEAQRTRAELLVGAFLDSMLVLDGEGCILDLSPAAEKLTGWQRQRVIGMPLERVLPLIDEATGIPVLPQTFVATDEFLSSDWLVLDAKGTRRPIDVSWSKRHGRNGAADIGILLLRDAGGSREAARLVIWEAGHDSLTRLLNRRGFLLALNDAWNRYRIEGIDSVVLMADLDGFKNVNDAAGHRAGDEMLCKVAACMTLAARASDHVVRLGGDEFAMLLSGCNPERALAIAATLIASVKAQCVIAGDLVLRVGVSIGCATFERDDSDAEGILQRADAGCYRAKSDGGDRVDDAAITVELETRQV